MSSGVDTSPGPRLGVPPHALGWALGLVVPLAGFVLLLARPHWDVHWENHRRHFWLVFLVAIVNTVVGLVLSEAARRRSDARVFLVALAFLASAGFLALHALATPDIVLAGKNTGFVIATPVGLFLGSCFAAASTLEIGGARSLAPAAGRAGS